MIVPFSFNLENNITKIIPFNKIVGDIYFTNIWVLKQIQKNHVIHIEIIKNNIKVIVFLFSNSFIRLANTPMQYNAINHIGEYPFKV
jgi:hypothetical protein